MISAAPAGASGSCAPGSFGAIEKVVKVVDKTISFEMKKLEKFINKKFINKKVLNPGDSISRTIALPMGVLLRTTVSRSADGHTYSFEEDLAKATSSPTFVEVGTASRTTRHRQWGADDEHIYFDFDVWGILAQPGNGALRRHARTRQRSDEARARRSRHDARYLRGNQRDAQ
jgi:hypothetical protein